ncbi:MAG: phosphoesterase [Pedosphaera sp.]|nr:phosphoesterase [Pedosphaera sp.]
MKCAKRLLPFWLLVAVILVLVVGIKPVMAASPVRQADEDVNGAELRARQGLHPDKNLLFNGWGVTPAGEHVPTSDLALKMVVAPDGNHLFAAHGGFNRHGLTVIDIATRKETQFIPLEESWNGLAFSSDGKQCFVSGGDSGQIHAFNWTNGEAKLDRSVSPSQEATEVFLAGIAVHPGTGKLYVCNEANHEIWVLNPKTLALETTIPVGQHPHTCVLGADRRHLYVSDWGSRSVSVVDTEKARHVRDIAVGLRPNDMALSPDGRLFVACSGDNTVHVIQTRALERSEDAASPSRRPPERTREIISTSLYPESPEGSTPDGVAVSPDGKTLFVANADNNSVAVVDISNSTSEKAREDGESVSVVEGFVPVGWYPSAVAVSPDSQTLFVANGKGLASRANFPAITSDARHLHKPPAFDYIGRTFDGSISFIRRPDNAQMAAYTKQVRQNSPYTPEQFQTAPIASDSVIPAKVGEACPIKYVLYIIKENRTYDQVFGDFRDAQGKPAGNGDSNLVMYGESVTPNHHQLARDYVLLDNLYCNSEVSVDGHSWCDAAMATDYNQRSWILSYSKHGKLPGNDEMEVPSAGYLWDLCKRHGLSFKNYGEGAKRVPSVNRGTWSAGRDMNRVQGWIEDLQKAEQTGVLPRFMIMSLGEDHTSGTKPGTFTPDASVASNDLGLGRIVEAASHSRFWKEMAIFVIEDDAQNGPDHVDAHRTAGLVISPYCKRGAVDSTLYTTASMVRTIELVLGLPPLTQYDAGATPMFNSFTKVAEPVSYQAITPQINMLAKNTSASPGAKKSAQMNFRHYDLAPEDELNRVLWQAAKGPDAPYPTPIHRVIFTTATRSAAESR